MNGFARKTLATLAVAAGFAIGVPSAGASVNQYSGGLDPWAYAAIRHAEAVQAGDGLSSVDPWAFGIFYRQQGSHALRVPATSVNRYSGLDPWAYAAIQRARRAQSGGRLSSVDPWAFGIFYRQQQGK